MRSKQSQKSRLLSYPSEIMEIIIQMLNTTSLAQLHRANWELKRETGAALIAKLTDSALMDFIDNGIQTGSMEKLQLAIAHFEKIYYEENGDSKCVDNSFKELIDTVFKESLSEKEISTKLIEIRHRKDYSEKRHWFEPVYQHLASRASAKTRQEEFKSIMKNSETSKSSPHPDFIRSLVRGGDIGDVTPYILQASKSKDQSVDVVRAFCGLNDLPSRSSGAQEKEIQWSPEKQKKWESLYKEMKTQNEFKFDDYRVFLDMGMIPTNHQLLLRFFWMNVSDTRNGNLNNTFDFCISEFINLIQALIMHLQSLPTSWCFFWKQAGVNRKECFQNKLEKIKGQLESLKEENREMKKRIDVTQLFSNLYNDFCSNLGVYSFSIRKNNKQYWDGLITVLSKFGIELCADLDFFSLVKKILPACFKNELYLAVPEEKNEKQMKRGF